MWFSEVGTWSYWKYHPVKYHPVDYQKRIEKCVFWSCWNSHVLLSCHILLQSWRIVWELAVWACSWVSPCQISCQEVVSRLVHMSLCTVPPTQDAAPILISTLTNGDVYWDFASGPNFFRETLMIDTLHIWMSEPCHQSSKKDGLNSIWHFLKP